MLGEVGDAEEAGGHAPPGTTPSRSCRCAGPRDRAQRIGRHEARQDVRLAEVAQAPGHQRDDADQAGHRLNQSSAPDAPMATRSWRGCRRPPPAITMTAPGSGRRSSAWPAPCRSSSPPGSRRSGCRRWWQRHRPTGPGVGHAEGAFEQARAGHDAGGAVDGEEHQDHQRGERCAAGAVGPRSGGEVVRQVSALPARSVYTRRGRHEAPVEVGADDQADGDPASEMPDRRAHRAGPSAASRSCRRRRRTARSPAPSERPPRM
jgi:hypothetical protein